MPRRGLCAKRADRVVSGGGRGPEHGDLGPRYGKADGAVPTSRDCPVVTSDPQVGPAPRW